MKKIIGLAFGLLLFVSNVNALDFGVGVKAGTLGAGIDLSAAVTKTINVRLSLTNVDLEGEDETLTVGDSVEGDLDAELDLDFGSNALLVDWFIFDGSFHLTGGMLRHAGEADLTGTLLSPATFDGGTISPSDLAGGEITGELKLADSYQPYIGIGWGRKAGRDGGVSFTVDFGIVLLDPSVELEATASGTGLSQADVNARLLEMEGDAEDELDDFEAWPILSAGVNYAF